MCDIKNCEDEHIEMLIVYDRRGNLDLCKKHDQMMKDYYGNA